MLHLLQVSLKKFYEALSELQSYYSVSWCGREGVRRQGGSKGWEGGKEQKEGVNRGREGLLEGRRID